MKRASTKSFNMLVPVAALVIIALMLFGPGHAGTAVSSGTPLHANGTQTDTRFVQSFEMIHGNAGQSAESQQGKSDNILILVLLSITMTVGLVNILGSMIEINSIRYFMSRRMRKKSISSGYSWIIDIKDTIHISSSHRIRVV